MQTENVLVIPTALANSLCPTLFSPVPANIEMDIFAQHSFREREEAEVNFDFKQVIPYLVVTYGNSFLLSQRTSQQQEKRLHNKYALGQGGHVNDLDLNHSTPLIFGLLREIKEEFLISDTIISCIPVGLVNENTTEVGKVHLGIVYRIEVNSPYFAIGEEGKHTAQWVASTDLSQFYASMENWSKILLDHYINQMPSAAA